MEQSRDSHGRFKADHTKRNLAIGALTAIGAVAAAVASALHLGFFDRFFPGGGEGHEAPDLIEDRPRPTAHDRAPDAFRPDPTAPVPASEREALRPAVGPAPSLVQDRGALRS